MLTLLHQLLGRNVNADLANQAFVEKVRSGYPRESRSRRSELVLIGGWGLIIIKCLVVWWLIRVYAVPIHPGWVIFPTIGAAMVCTWLYWRR